MNDKNMNTIPDEQPTEQEANTCECGGMLFVLSDGSKFCLNCGETQEEQ